MKTDKLLKQFSTLTYVQQNELLEKLKQSVSSSKPILQHKKLNKECIYCKGTKVYKHGTYANGGTRYRCQDCKKSYNELTGTSIHCIKKKDVWDRYIDLMFQSKSVKEISKEIGISYKTSFTWRHKILSSFENIFTKEFKGIVETDDVGFTFNQKGRKRNKRVLSGKRNRKLEYNVCVLMTMDRYKTYDFRMVKIGSLDTKNIHRVMDTNKFNEENVICSDRSPVLLGYIRSTGITSRSIISKKGKNVDGVYHGNTLNGSVNH